jgi:hypothetical protein
MKLTPDATAKPKIPAPASFGTGYETNYNAVMANHSREEYTALYTVFQTLAKLKVAGIQEITVKSHNGSVTIPLGGPNAYQRGMNLGAELSEALGDRLTALEKDILRYEEDSQNEEREEREGAGARAQVLGFCLPMRRLSDAEFAALPAEARRAFDEHRAECIGQPAKGGLAA